MSYFDPVPTTIAAGTRALASQVNAVANAIAAGFDMLPTETELKLGLTRYAVDTGVADAYIVTLPYVPTLTDGFNFSFKAVNANTGPATMNANGTGVKSIVNPDGSALIAGTFGANAIVIIAYESVGDRYILVSQNPAQSALAQASAIAAAASAAAALVSEGNAATSEANAATSETNAATSETNAATSEANAAASFLSFDQRYLGSKASDPALDNQGMALIDGALYWNTTLNQMNVYDLGTTTWIPFSAITNADTLDGLDSTQFLRSDVDTSLSTSSTNTTMLNITGNSLTSGFALNLSTNNAGYVSAGLIDILVSNASSNGALMRLQNDGTGANSDGINITTAGGAASSAINIQGTSTGTAIFVSQAQTTGQVVTIQGDSKTSGSMSYFSVNNAGFASGQVMQIEVINASSGGDALVLTQGGTGRALAATGGIAAFAAATTNYASIRLPHGTAPSSPVDGDIWTTSTSIFARINGSTVDIGGAGGGVFTLDSDENLYAGTGAGAALVGTSALQNFLAGNNAGGRITTGDDNIAIGQNAGRALVTNSNNIAIGNAALGDNTATPTADNNIAIGQDAMNSSALTTATDNIIIGRSGAGSLTSGYSNIAIGALALDNNLIGFHNVCIGEEAGEGITSGSVNIAIGLRVMDSGGLTGAQNIGMGQDALSGPLTTANSNIGIGNNSMVALVSGDNNIAIGASALNSITTGGNNTVIGNGAAQELDTTSDSNIIIGRNAGPATTAAINGMLYIDNSETDTPLILGNFTANTLEINGELQLNAYSENSNSFSVTAGTKALDVSAETYFYAAAAMTAVAYTFQFDNPTASGRVSSFTIELINAGSASSITWPASVEWDGGVEPSWTGTGTDLVSFITRDGGTTWYGMLGGQNFS